MPRADASVSSISRVPICSSFRSFNPNNATDVGRTDKNAIVPLALTLPLRNSAALNQFLSDLYNPKSPVFHHFITPEEFTDRYCPTVSEYDHVMTFAEQYGLHVTGTHSNRTVIDVSGTVAAAEQAFSVHLRSYVNRHCIIFQGPDRPPTVPTNVAGQVSGVIGLETAEKWHAYDSPITDGDTPSVERHQSGTGIGGGLSPNDIRTAYALNSGTLTGSGQTLGLFELDGFNPSDIAAYESHYGLPNVSVDAVPVDGYDGTAGPNATEVTLDIELQIAAAPGVAKVLVYEAPNSNVGVVDTYSKIAADNIAKEISTSWGLAETQASADVLNGENTAFKQMAAQGQTMFAAAGDQGAYDDGKTLSVDDPASQPYVTGVGGTTLTLNPDGTYASETTWSHGSISAGASGGGFSRIWGKPYWQGSVGASSAMRNVPDVCLNADPSCPYSVYYKGNWVLFGGTSCAAPIWAGFTALVNQQRTTNGAPPLGFFNPTLYSLASGDQYSSDFHDIADGSNNLQYVAVPGYDNATGWGSMNGVNLLADLAPAQPLSFIGTPSVIRRRGGMLVRWETNRVATTIIHIGTSPTNLQFTGVFGRASTLHGVNVYGFVRGRTYYFTVESGLQEQKVVSKVMSITSL